MEVIRKLLMVLLPMTAFLNIWSAYIYYSKENYGLMILSLIIFGLILSLIKRIYDDN